jgi:hypothetical protein
MPIRVTRHLTYLESPCIGFPPEQGLTRTISQNQSREFDALTFFVSLAVYTNSKPVARVGAPSRAH